MAKGVRRCLGVMLVVAASFMVLTAPTAGAATPLATVTVTVNRPPVDGLLSLCITSRSLDPNGTCLTAGRSLPTVASGTMTGRVGFSGSDWTPFQLTFAGSDGGPGLTTGAQYAFPISYAPQEQSLYAPDPFAYQATDGSGTCVTGQDPQATDRPTVRGINWFEGLPLPNPVFGNSLPSVPGDTEPMWGQLPCNGTFAGHSGPFTLSFAGTVTFSGGPCFCAWGDFQGGWVATFGS